LLRMRLGGETGFHPARRGHATALGPRDEALGRPLGIIAVRPGQVRSHRPMAALDPQAPVTGHPLAFMKEFNDLSAEAGIELLFDQGVGHGIVVTADVHVGVDIHAHPFPLGVVIRQGGKRTEGGAISSVQRTLPGAGQFLEGTGMEFR